MPLTGARNPIAIAVVIAIIVSAAILAASRAGLKVAAFEGRVHNILATWRLEREASHHRSSKGWLGNTDEDHRPVPGIRKVMPLTQKQL